MSHKEPRNAHGCETAFGELFQLFTLRARRIGCAEISPLKTGELEPAEASQSTPAELLRRDRQRRYHQSKLAVEHRPEVTFSA